MKKGILGALIIMILVGLVASACGGKKDPLPPIPAGTQIAIRNYAFEPSTLTIEKGTVVVWVNYDSVRHDIVGPGIKSGLFGKGRFFSFTFNEPVTYDYVCGVHPFMNGEIVVR